MVNIDRPGPLDKQKCADDDGPTALIATVRRRPVTPASLQMASHLLKYGANVDQTDFEGESALMAAIRWTSSADMVRLLLENGADVNYNYYREDGETICAMDYASREIRDLLVSAGGIIPDDAR